MHKLDSIFLSFILAPILPILLFLLSWWTSLMFIADSYVFIPALVSLVSGVVLDIFYLKRWVRKAYKLSIFIWLLIYIFYSIAFFGFFMGVPVFNLFLGIPVGIFTSRQAKFLDLTRKETDLRIHKASIISVLYILIISLVSATIALRDPYTASNLEGMFKLNFEVTEKMLNNLIMFGSVVLLVSQYAITRLSFKLADLMWQSNVFSKMSCIFSQRL